MANWGTDERKFIRSFTLRSKPQLGATFPEYKKVINLGLISKVRWINELLRNIKCLLFFFFRWTAICRKHLCHWVRCLSSTE